MKTVPVFLKRPLRLWMRYVVVSMSVTNSSDEGMEVADVVASHAVTQATTRWAHQQSEVGSPIRGFLARSVAEVD